MNQLWLWYEKLSDITQLPRLQQGSSLSQPPFKIAPVRAFFISAVVIVTLLKPPTRVGAILIKIIPTKTKTEDEVNFSFSVVFAFDSSKHYPQQPPSMFIIRTVLTRKLEVIKRIPTDYRKNISNIDFLNKDAVAQKPIVVSRKMSLKLTLVSEDTVELSCLHIKSCDG